MGRFFNFWELSERERKGYILLLMLIVLILVAPWVYRHFFRNEIVEKPSLQLLDSLRLSRSDTSTSPTRTSFNSRNFVPDYSKKDKGSLFFFNPNNLSEEQWRALGFSAKQIQVIKNYEKKGGYFRNKADLAKIYSISERQLQRIAPYLLFDSIAKPVVVDKKVVSSSYVAKSTTLKIDLNRADTTELKKLLGIGSAFSKRIVAFRERLGGYHAIGQLAEVYGLPPELLSAIQHQLYVDSSFPLQKITFKTATVADLIKHPYIDRKTATLLIRYRDQHAPIKGIEELKNILALPEGFLHKIEPYLSFN